MAGPASAEYIGTLSFIEPTGTVGPMDTIPMRVRLTLDPASDPLMLSDDATATPPFGIPPSNYPDSGGTADFSGKNYSFVAFTSLAGVGFTPLYTCDGTFVGDGCSADSPYPYNWEFEYVADDAISSGGFEAAGVNLAPGESLDFTFGKFVPKGPVPAGTYYDYEIELDLVFWGRANFRVQATDDDGALLYDDDGRAVWLPDLFEGDAWAHLQLGTTPCPWDADPSCVGAFSRTVVPVPGAVWLLASACGALGWRLRRRAGNRA